MELPEAVAAVLDKWQQIADKEMETYEFGWFAKYVSTEFVYGDVQYRLKPETFGVPDDLMEQLQGGLPIERKYGTSLTEDLRMTAGISHVASYGFLD